MAHFNYLLSIPRTPHPVVGWSLLILVCKSRLLNIQEFCKLVVKLAVVGVFMPWKLTNATNWGLLFFGGELAYQHTTAHQQMQVLREKRVGVIHCCVLNNQGDAFNKVFKKRLLEKV